MDFLLESKDHKQNLFELAELLCSQIVSRQAYLLRDFEEKQEVKILTPNKPEALHISVDFYSESKDLFAKTYCD